MNGICFKWGQQEYNNNKEEEEEDSCACLQVLCRTLVRTVTAPIEIRRGQFKNRSEKRHGLRNLCSLIQCYKNTSFGIERYYKDIIIIHVYSIGRSAANPCPF
jgi:hypothetical protein